MSGERSKILTIHIVIMYFLLPVLIYASTMHANNRVAVLVVTVGRSGSSCLSGILEILGVPFGPNVLQKDCHNPKGFFENTTTSFLNSLILREVLVSEDRPYCIDWDTHPKKEWCVKIIKKHIEKEFKDVDIFGIKNLSLAYLLPVYTDALEALGYTPKIIIALRDPYKVCKSFQVWPAQCNSTESLYMGMAVKFAAMLKDVFSSDAMAVCYDNLLQDTKKVVDKINMFIPCLQSYDSVQEELELFIDLALRHH